MPANKLINKADLFEKKIVKRFGVFGFSLLFLLIAVPSVVGFLNLLGWLCMRYSDNSPFAQIVQFGFVSLERPLWAIGSGVFSATAVFVATPVSVIYWFCREKRERLRDNK